MKERSGRGWADDEKIGLFLVKEKMITEDQFNTASDFQRTVGGHVHEVLLRLGFVQDEALNNFFSKYPDLVGDDDVSNASKSDAAEVDGPADTPDPVKADGKGDVAEPAQPDEVSEAAWPAEDTVESPAQEAGADVLESGSHSATLAAAREAVESSPDSHTGIILDALLRLLIRKEIFDGEEIKEEIMRMELEEHGA